jgi:hypothetical protein
MSVVVKSGVLGTLWKWINGAFAAYQIGDTIMGFLGRNPSQSGSTGNFRLTADEFNNIMDMSADDIDKYIQSRARQIDVEEILEKGIGVLRERMALKEEEKGLFEELARAQAAYDNANKDTYVSSFEEGVQRDAAEDKVNKYTADLAALDGQYSEIIERIGGYTTAMESGASATETMTEAMDASAIAAELMAAVKEKTMMELAREYSLLADAATDMFNRLCDASGLSAAEMTENLNENQRVIADWADNIASLFEWAAEEGVDAGFLEVLRAAGPQAAGHVNALVQASEEELRELSETFVNGGEVALQALATSLGLDMSVAEAAANIAAFAAASLVDRLEEADIPSIGRSVSEGLARGIIESIPAVEIAARRLAAVAEWATRSALEMNSPSKVFEGIGKSTVDGMILGLKMKEAELNRTTKEVMSLGDIAPRTMTLADAMYQSHASGNKKEAEPVVIHQHIQAVPLTPSQLADETRAAFIRAKWL